MKMKRWHYMGKNHFYDCSFSQKLFDLVCIEIYSEFIVHLGWIYLHIHNGSMWHKVVFNMGQVHRLLGQICLLKILRYCAVCIFFLLSWWLEGLKRKEKTEV